MNEGEPVTYGKGATKEDLQNAAANVRKQMAEGNYDAAAGYADIIASGVTVADAFDALGDTEETRTLIDAIFTTPEGSPVYSGEVTAPMADDVAAYYGRVMQDKIVSPEERLDMQKIATDRGISYADMVAAGVDPNILYQTTPAAKPVTPKTPVTAPIVGGIDPFPTGPATPAPDPFPMMPDTGGIYAAGQPALDEAFRASAPRTEVIEDVGGQQQLTGFDYTPAAKLLSATGSGFSFTPPSVTSRPRSLMGTEQLGRFQQGRAAQEFERLKRSGMFPDQASTAFDADAFNQLAGSYGSMSRSQLNALMRQQGLQNRAAQKNAPSAGGTIAEYIAANPDIQADYERQKGQLGGQNLNTFARNHYNTFGKSEMAAGTRAPFTLAALPPTPFYGFDEREEDRDYGSQPNYTTPLSANTGFNRTYGLMAEGGPVKKPKGFADGGSASANLKALMDVTADTFSGAFGPIAASAISLGEQAFTDNTVEEMAANKAAYNEALNYEPRTEKGQALNEYAMGKIGEVVQSGVSAYKKNKDNLGPIPDMIDYGMEQYDKLDPETQFALINALTVGEVVPIGKGVSMAKRGITTPSAKMLDEVDAVNAFKIEPVQPIKFTEEYAQEMRATLPEAVNTDFYKGADVASSPYTTPIGEIFNRQIVADPEGMIARYNAMPDTEGGKILDTDLFRELNPNYLADRTLATDVHEAASALNKAVYNRKLAETAGQEGTWIFTGGGPASGKSSGPAKAMREGADLIYDGSMSNFDSMAKRIDEALNSGKNAKLVFIDRSPEKAIGLAVGRAMKQANKYGTGRTIPKDEFIRMHMQSRQTIKNLAERYKDFDNVDIKVVDNNGGMGDEFLKKVEDIADIDYNESLKRVETSLMEMKNEGKGTISQDIYDGFSRVYRKEQVPQPSGKSTTPEARQGVDRGNAEQTIQPVKPLEVGVDETLSGGQRLKNYTPDNLKTLETLATKATAGTRKADALINAPVEAGSKVGIRLNLNSKIPDAPKGLDKLQTLHKNNFNGKALSYVPYATVENVTFNVNQKGRQGIAAKISNIDVPEAKNKFPAMSVDGNYVPDKNVLLDGKDFVEIGFNPKAHHLFIDMNTGQAVKGADLATVVGDRVYAKGIQYYKKSEAPDPLNASDGTDLPSQVRYQKMKRGGSVERVYNDPKYI